MLLEFYFVFFFGILVFDFSRKYKDVRPLFFFFLILFAMIIAGRNLMEHDTRAYTSFFNELPFGSFSIEGNRFDKGFQILTGLLKILSLGNVRVYFFYIVIINFLFLCKAAKNILPLLTEEYSYEIYELFFLFFLSYSGIFYFAITIRSSIAICITVYANSIYLSKRKKIIPFLLILFASVFHISAILFGMLSYFIFLISKKPFSKKMFYLLWFVTGVIYFFNLSAKLMVSTIKTPLFSDILNFINPSAYKLFVFYAEATWDIDFGVSKRYLLYYVLELIFIIHYQKNDVLEFKLLVVYCVGMLIMTGGRMIAQIERVSDFFVIYQSFLLCNYVKLNKKILQSSYVYYLFLFIILFSQILFSVNLFNMGLTEAFQ
ncbi:MAG: EpsG family protein [Treponema sp.]|nr:EpsG family protein [Treponema sp.]